MLVSVGVLVSANAINEDASVYTKMPLSRGWTGVLMTEGSSFHWRTKPRHVSSETSRRVGLEFVCVLDTTG